MTANLALHDPHETGRCWPEDMQDGDLILAGYSIPKIAYLLDGKLYDFDNDKQLRNPPRYYSDVLPGGGDETRRQT